MTSRSPSTPPFTVDQIYLTHNRLWIHVAQGGFHSNETNIEGSRITFFYFWRLEWCICQERLRTFHAVEQGSIIYCNNHSSNIVLQCCNSLSQKRIYTVSCPSQKFICCTQKYVVDNMVWGKLHTQSLIFFGLNVPKAYILIKDQHCQYLKQYVLDK